MSITASPKHNLNISDGTDPDASDRPSPPRTLAHSPTMKAKSGTSDQIPKPLFMTGTGTTISGKKGDEKIGKMEDVMNYHDKLNRYIEQLDNKVKNRLHDNQTSFLMAYKEQMTIIQRELALLKRKVDEETYRRKNDERMNILEQERNWFRAEAIRLDHACKEQQRLIDELRFKLKIVTEDKGHFEDFVLAAKKKNKALKEELEQLEQTRKNYEDTNFIMQSPPQAKLLPSNLRRGQLTGSSKRGLASRKNMLIEGNENFQPNLGELSDSQQNKSANEEKLSEIIKQLKADLDKEKKMTRQLRNEKSQMLVNRIELEQILVESINEVKKDISRRRSAKTYKDLDKGPVVSQDVDIAKFSATDKKNLLEYFLSNEAVLDELYNLVFNNPNSGPRVNTVPDLDKGQTLHHNLHTSNSTRSDTKMKYTFNYGFGSTANLKLGPKDLENFSMSQRTHALVGEIKRDVKRSDPKKEL